MSLLFRGIGEANLTLIARIAKHISELTLSDVYVDKDPTLVVQIPRKGKFIRGVRTFLRR